MTEQETQVTKQRLAQISARLADIATKEKELNAECATLEGLRAKLEATV